MTRPAVGGRPYVLKPATFNKLVQIINDYDRGLLKNRPERPLPPASPHPVLAKITALANDYLTVKRVDSSGNVVGAEINVAKPWKARHDANQFPHATTITTTDTNTVEASDGSTDETWKMTVEYQVGDFIMITPIAYSGVTVSDADLKWIDLNVDGRHWAKEE